MAHHNQISSLHFAMPRRMTLVCGQVVQNSQGCSTHRFASFNAKQPTITRPVAVHAVTALY